MPTLKTLRRLLHNNSGASAIEFAIIAPAFIAMLVAIIQIAFVFLAQDGLETGAESAGRILMTGQAQRANMTAAQFRSATCNALPPFLKCSNLMIDVTTVSSFSGASTGAPTIAYDSSGNVTNSFSYSMGTQGAIVVVRLFYLWPVAPGPLGFNLANQPGNQRLLASTSVLKSEYY
jgi:Flp pilus assembly protein TadG